MSVFLFAYEHVVIWLTLVKPIFLGLPGYQFKTLVVDMKFR